MTFSIYIHWPFCLSKCPYCDFNSHVHTTIDQKQWQQALLKEMTFLAESVPYSSLNTLFFGGGTPSLMAPDTVGLLIEQAKKYWHVDTSFEVTLEANPTSVEKDKLYAFAEAGVNRLSLGVQSLYQENLTFLGRTHTANEALKAIELGKDLFPRFSFDLMYGHPHQTPQAWKEELTEALALKPTHLSLYQLTYEPGTPFYTRFQRGDLSYPLEKEALSFYDITQNLTLQAGLQAYEVSNYALPQEACLHNLTYWRSQPYGGVGPGAHGRLYQGQQKYALRNHRAPEIWLQEVEKKGEGLKSREALTPLECFTEIILMGLRLHEGIPLKRFVEQTEKPLEEWVEPFRLTRLLEENLISLESDILSLTAKGRLRLNAVVAYLC